VATTPWVAGLYADLFAYKIADPRVTFQQLEDEQARATLVPVAPRVEGDEPLRWQLSRDVRLSVATVEQDTGLVPILPRPARDEVEWQRWGGAQYQNQTQEIDAGPLPLIPTRAWDELDWQHRWEGFFAQTTEQDLLSQVPNPPAAFADGEESRDFTEKRFWLEGDVRIGIPLLPSTAWLEENAAAVVGSSGPLAAMVMMDEFVNAPSGGSTFGPAPRGRSVRFGFSIPAFR